MGLDGDKVILYDVITNNGNLIVDHIYIIIYIYGLRNLRGIIVEDSGVIIDFLMDLPSGNQRCGQEIPELNGGL